MSNTNVNIEDQFKYVSKFYDLTLINGNDLTSILKIILYFPVGLVLISLRLFLIIILKLLLVLIPSLKSNLQFIQLSCFCYGIQARLATKIESPTDKNDDDSKLLKIFISNHVSCLDYYSIKSLVNKVNYANSNNSMSSLCSCFVNLFENSIKNKQDDDFYAQKSNYPLLFFPEQYCTNGRFGLLKFDSQPFDIVINNKDDDRIVIFPICLKLTRPYIPLSINYVNSNDLINLLLTLFAPITIYNIEVLNQIEKLPDETSDQLNDRVRNILAKNLNFELSDLDGNQIKYVWSAYERHLESLIQQQQRQQQNINNTNRRTENRDISFDEISRLALQIKDILPNVSFETIQRHVQKSSTLDLESILASILDSNDHELNEDENTNNNNNSFGNDSSSLLPMTSMTKTTSPVSMKRNDSSSSTALNNKRSYRSFQERKFELLNDARQRYLAKHAK
jgi:ancient ubiquitous protein 1